MKITLDYSTLLYISALAMLITGTLIPRIIRIAKRIAPLDKPSERKIHKVPTPAFGGIPLFLISMLCIICWMPNSYEEKYYLLTALPIIYGISFIDDLYDISPFIRLAAQFLCASILFMGGIKIDSLHGIFGIHEISTPLSYFLTVIVFSGVLNGFNFTDGIDGLTSSITSISILFLSFIFIQNDFQFETYLCLAIISSCIVFLRYNFSVKLKIFLGDNGSMLLGFLLFYLGLKGLNIESVVNSNNIMISIGVFILPVFDSIRLIATRILNKTSPFKPDNNHLHHLILRRLKSHWSSTLAISSYHALILTFCYNMSNEWVTLHLIGGFAFAYGILPLIDLTDYIISLKKLRNLKRSFVESTQTNVLLKKHLHEKV